MLQIAALGGSEFVMGFALAGVRNICETTDASKDIRALRGNADIGIVIVEEKILANLDMHERREIEDSVRPVFIPISEVATQENLRRMIKKSLGIDVWKEG